MSIENRDEFTGGNEYLFSYFRNSPWMDSTIKSKETLLHQEK